MQSSCYQQRRFMHRFFNSKSNAFFLSKTSIGFVTIQCKKKTDYGDTLHLPKTTFKLQTTFNEEVNFYQNQVSIDYRRQRASNTGRPTFLLLDGPPFANGNLHIGHAFNKLLKDIILRIKILQGYSVRMIPGWDVHGLPIEIKALQHGRYQFRSLNDEVNLQQQVTPKPEVSAAEKALLVRNKAAQVADFYIDKQHEQFRSLGVMGDWDAYYTTKEPAYEASELRIFRRIVEKGLIKRTLRPIYWSSSSQTALAESELEYDEAYSSTALYFSYPIYLADGRNCFLLIWTSTPWTLPANKAS